MKKTVLFLCLALLLCSLITVNAQVKRVIISEKEIGSISALYTKRIDLEAGDTNYHIYLGFQNAKYQHITDIKSILFYDLETQESLIKDLSMALSEMGSKTSITWKKDKYSIALYDFSSDLYLYDGKQSGHTILQKKKVEQLIAWLNSLNLGSDVIK